METNKWHAGMLVSSSGTPMVHVNERPETK
jgi:hypothetical protein